MRPIVTDRVAWSVSRSAGLSVSVVSPAKTTEPTEMLFRLRTRVGGRPREPDGGPDPHEKGKFVKYIWNILRSSGQKRLNRSRCRLGCGLGWAQGIMC